MQVKNGDEAIPALVSATPVPPLATSTALPAGDALRADIAAMQQQALSIQASIRDLKQREADLSSSYFPEMPGMPGMPEMSVLDGHYSADTVLLLPALALAALLFWIRTRRSSPLAAAAPVSAPAPFVEKRAAPRPGDDPHWVDRDLDFVASDHHSDWGQDAVGEMGDDTGADSRFWEPEAQAKPAAFDSETAAVEVHKVRASLAHKRAARAMGHGSHHAPLSADDGDHAQEGYDNHDVTADYGHLRPPPAPLAGRSTVDLELDIDLPPAEPQPMLGASAGRQDVEVDPHFGGDLDVDLGLKKTAPPQVEPEPELKPEIKPAPEPEPQPEPELDSEPKEADTEPPSFSYPDDPVPHPAPEHEALPEPAQDADSDADTGADGETPSEIQLALAQEFLALGLLPGARDIATELMDSPHDHVREQARALLAEIKVQEGVEHMPLFESSAFVDPSSLLLSTAGQPLASSDADPE
ncbi:MAG: hypothetical protein CFE43_12750 [Burkholderiales bacterium PBB3]|nr:MAG: hypothetical protein CFE43_12750 [Burkholderiales bacterium PBB3]